MISHIDAFVKTFAFFFIKNRLILIKICTILEQELEPFKYRENKKISAQAKARAEISLCYLVDRLEMEKAG